jgi:hypothetical protein
VSTTVQPMREDVEVITVDGTGTVGCEEVDAVC